MLSNAPARSASRIHTRLDFPHRVWNKDPIASWQPRPGRNPYDRGSNRASHSGSSALRTRAWWHLSLITGMPSGRILVLSLALGIYTRRTATGCHEFRVACTCTATSARARLVSATCPSTPAVLRPVLRCVTWRTLISVLDQDRSTNFCRFLTVARSPSFAALKILHRSRRTRSSCTRQSTCSQASPSKTESGSSGPFTEVFNLPLSSGICVCFDSKAHLSTSAPLSGPGTTPGIRPVIRRPSGTRFLVVRPAVSCCLSAAGVRFLDTLSCQTGFRPHCCRPTAGTTHTRACAADPGRVYTFRTYETRTGWGALSTPGTTVFAGHRLIRVRRLPPTIGWSLLIRYYNPTPDVAVSRHLREFPGSSPMPALPLACSRNGWDGSPWTFP